MSDHALVWVKCDECSREYLIDARSVQRGVGDPPLAHHALTREPMTCPWCRHVGVRVVTGSGNGPVTTIDPETGRLVPTPDEDADAREVAL